MDSQKIAYEPIAGFDNVVRIPLEDIDDTHIVFQVLQDSFEICFRDGKTRIVVDLQNVQFPTASLIALLVEATSRTRRLNGDVKIINLSKSAKNNLITFSPTSYLSLETEEKFALEDFQETFVPQDEMLESTRDEIIDAPQQETNGPVPGETHASIPDETPKQVEDKTTTIEDQLTSFRICLKTVSRATNTHGWGRYPGHKDKSSRTSETRGLHTWYQPPPPQEGPPTGPAADPAVAVRMCSSSSLPQGRKAGKFSLSRSHPRLYESPLTPAPPPPRATP